MADSRNGITESLESRVSTIEGALKFDERIKAIETKLYSEGSSETKAVPWWKNFKAVAGLILFIAGLVPAVNQINGMINANRESQRLLMEQQDRIRQVYLDRILKPGLTEGEQQRILGLLVKLKNDPELQEWANEEYNKAIKNVDELVKAKQNLEDQYQSLRSQLEEIKRENFGQQTTQSKIRLQQLEVELSKRERELNELRQRISGTVSKSVPSYQVTLTSGREVARQVMPEGSGGDGMDNSGDFCDDRLAQAQASCPNGVSVFMCDPLTGVFSYTCQ
jgi:hypothetical protein